MTGRLSHSVFLIKGYIRYLLSARSLDSVHSPFVFELYEQVILNKHSFYKFQLVESIRASLLLSDETINALELGAGRGLNKTSKKKISSIAGNSAKPVKYGQLLFRLVNFFRPKKILELGTSLGISTLYLALPDSNSKVLTIEGCPQTAAFALKNFSRLHIKNIELIPGNIDDMLLPALNKAGTIDFVFFDGNHRKEPTLSYFKHCLQFSNEYSVFIFDDIHWSVKMEEAWEEIKKHPSVTTTIDLFFLGIVLFRKEMSKEHLTLRF